MKEEEGFLRALLARPDDRTTRLVYADWLDEHDDGRGEFLRLELRLEELPPDDGARAAALSRLRELRVGIDLGWLARLDRARVENCFRFAFACPQRWEQLRPTADALVRWCESCRKEVHYCGSVGEARNHAYQDHCVAVDSRLARSEGDLPPNRDDEMDFMTLGVLVPEMPPRREPPPRRRWWQFWKGSR